MSKDDDAGSWFTRLKHFLNNEPSNKEELIDLLREAQLSALIDVETLSMIEGVIQFSELRVRDIMLPKKQMVTLTEDADLSDILNVVTTSGHSRFPVFGKNETEILGILHAKDLLSFFKEKTPSFQLKNIIRTTLIVPESKKLSFLLKECRNTRNHMALVVDEYGTLSGLITIENIIEQIIGDIADEFDINEYDFITHHGDNHYMVKAKTPIHHFNHILNSSFPVSQKDETIGELLMNALGHLPKCGEVITVEGFEFKIVNADTRGIKLLSCLDNRQ